MKYNKIYIVGPTESLLTKRGNRHPALAQFLIEQGCELEYITSNFYHAEKRWFSEKEINEAKKCAPYKLTVKNCLGYKTNISPRRVISNFLLSLKFFFYLLPRLNKKTILVLPSRPVEMIFAAALLRLIRKTSVALDIQDIWPDMLVIDSQLKRAFFWSYCNFFLYPSLRFIDKFFHVAPSFVSWLNRYAPKARSTFIPLGFDAKRWEEALPKKTNHDSTNIQLICIAQLTFQFNLMPLLKALDSRRTFDLKIIGEDGTGERYHEVMEFIKKQKLNNVEMLGVVDRELMVQHLKDADIGIVPMVSTSIPNKVFDYIASYIPPLILGKNDSASFVKEHNIGWSVLFDEKDIGDFLDTVSRNDIDKKSHNITNVRQQFNRDNIHKKIMELIMQ